MRPALALGELSAALPLSSLAFSPSCASGCSTSKESCNATTAIAITNPRPNNRSMRGFIYVLVAPEQHDSWYRELCLARYFDYAAFALMWCCPPGTRLCICVGTFCRGKIVGQNSSSRRKRRSHGGTARVSYHSRCWLACQRNPEDRPRSGGGRVRCYLRRRGEQ